MTPTARHEQLARELLDAERAAVPVEPLSERFPDATVADAYEVQRCGRALRLASGDRLVGRKVGLTSRAMQQMLGVEQPDYGCLLASMVVSSGATVDVARLIAPRVEAEIAFVLDHPLAGPGVRAQDVLEAAREVVPALEIIDSRVADWRIGIVDTIADNASSAIAVLGEARPLADLALAKVEMTLEAGGEAVVGRGDAVLGHPAEPIAWLANAIAEYGEHLHAHDLLLPGALAKALPVGAGGVARAEFRGMGGVDVRFEERDGE